MRIVIAEDQVLLRDGLVRLLSGAGHAVVGQVGDGRRLVAEVSEQRPDLVIADVRMPPTYTDEGLVAASRIREEFPGVGVLVLSTYAETAYAVALLSTSTGGTGYLLKDRVDDVASLLDALERIAAGETVVDPDIVRRLLSRRRNTAVIDRLADRERDVLELMAQGRSNAGIAHALYLSTKTVEKHIANVFTHLDLVGGTDDNRRVLAVLTWLRNTDPGPHSA